MDVKVPKGKYVVAVSGGVDSMTLLHLLAQKRQLTADSLQLTVAHFNHGIRPDAAKDEELVRQAAASYGLPFEAGRGSLGPSASEEKARQARYAFLKKIRQKHQADAIITAHHQDDLIETAVINLLRGTGRRGLSAIADNPDVLRPLLGVPKKDIVGYSKRHKLEWHDDPTNQDERYLRNFVRLRIMPRLSTEQRLKLLRGIKKVAASNQVINQEIATLSQKIIHQDKIERQAFTDLPAAVANEVMVQFLRQNSIHSFDKRTVDRLSTAIKAAKAGSTHDIIKGKALGISRSNAHLIDR